MTSPEIPIGLVALLGRRDQPTDGVEDYCVCLGQACGRRGIPFELVRVPWAERGWLASLRWLWKESARWQGRWVLVQYTALGWSRRGFPLGLLPVLFLLRRRNVSLAVVFHDAAPYSGARWVDRVRQSVQRLVMRKAFAEADRAILPTNPEYLDWLPRKKRGKAVFIPVGSNIPAPALEETVACAGGRRESKMVAVFGITPGSRGRQEMTDMLEAVKGASECAAPIHLCAFGRGSKEAESELRRLFEAAHIEVSVLGLLPAAQIGEMLSHADVQVDVRDGISSRRGSVIAGIVCGTPVVGFEGAQTDEAIRDAGVVLVPPGDIKALTVAVSRILSDDAFRDEMRSRNRSASRKWFSWDAILDQFLSALRTAHCILLL